MDKEDIKIALIAPFILLLLALIAPFAYLYFFLFPDDSEPEPSEDIIKRRLNRQLDQKEDLLLSLSSK